MSSGYCGWDGPDGCRLSVTFPESVRAFLAVAVACMQCRQAGRQACPGLPRRSCLPADSSSPNAQGTHPPGQDGKNASPVLLMQIPLTAHGLMWHKPAYAASDASQQDWQDGCISWNGPARAATPPPFQWIGPDGTNNNPPTEDGTGHFSHIAALAQTSGPHEKSWSVRQ